MNEITVLIEKLWSKTITAAEQRRLSELINGAPLDLQNALKEEFDKGVRLQQQGITEQRFQDLLAILHNRMDQQVIPPARSIPLYNWLKIVAALIVVTLGTVLYINRAQIPPLQPMAANSQKAIIQTLHQPFNSGKMAMKIKLSDGSTVTLQPGSSLSYYQPFNNSTRSISMKGEATFKVAKDKQHPFMVNANGFTTTALGTEFTINTDKKDHITVRLMEGKVVIRSDAENEMQMKDVYLLPGHQLSINTRLKKEEVTLIEANNKPVELVPKVKTVTSEPLAFNQAPLTTVFSRLAERYDINISYSGLEDAELRKLYFTGSFKATEKLEIILPAICNMNGLTFTRNNGNITISK